MLHFIYFDGKSLPVYEFFAVGDDFPASFSDAVRGRPTSIQSNIYSFQSATVLFSFALVFHNLSDTIIMLCYLASPLLLCGFALGSKVWLATLSLRPESSKRTESRPFSL